MAKTISFILILFKFINLAESQNVVFIEEVLPRSDSSIIFPVIKGISGSDSINSVLKRNIEKCFNLDNIDDLNLTFENAIPKGLDSLSYFFFEADSTISFCLSISLQQGKTKSGWKDYFTFSKSTGKQLYLEDLFPEADIGMIYARVLELQIQHIQSVRANVMEKYKIGALSQKEFSVLIYLIDKHMLASFSEEYLLTEEYFIFKNGIILPNELSQHIPDFFRVSKNELLLNAAYE
jgi:hypothetical protein